jgi:hypothetical protein
MAQGQPGQGAGTGRPGRGQGGIVPEDEGISTGFETDLAESALSAGRNLLEWKERAVNAPGDAPEEYDAAVEAVKEGVDEAIVDEQVPPGYHGVIKQYFDTLEGDDVDGNNDAGEE